MQSIDPYPKKHEASRLVPAAPDVPNTALALSLVYYIIPWDSSFSREGGGEVEISLRQPPLPPLKASFFSMMEYINFHFFIDDMI